MKNYIIKEDILKISKTKKVILQTYDVECMPWIGNYETCISLNNGKSYKVIKEHKTKEEAILYHNKLKNSDNQILEKYKL